MGHILIAEDDDAMRNFLARSLERAGHEVVAVGSGTEALPHIASEQFDLLLTDIVMPGMDGLALAKRAAILAPGMKVVFITGFAAVALNHGDEPVTAEARVLSKPFHLKDVVAAIDELTAA
ncbi:MAG: response regulator [Alphaproteobacteria bacterium]|nr:MAG: response regulator [Alphaproteobacteria bacterium]